MLGTLTPSMAMTPSMPLRIRLFTSALPSTTIISLDLLMSGDADSRSLPYFTALIFLSTLWTSPSSCSISWPSFTTQFLMSSLALATMAALFSLRTSVMLSILMVASHGPTLSTVSMAAAISAVSARSRLLGASITPEVLSFADFSLISMRPIFPDFWSSRSSNSLGKSPSVWPKIAPITSCFSTTPSTVKFALITYFSPANFSVSFTCDHLLLLCHLYRRGP